MAFIDISDPDKRKEIVQKYIEMKNELKTRAENAKENNLLKEKVTQQQYQPIITATKESAEKITSALKRESVYEFYARQTKNKDKYFSIHRDIPGMFRLGQTNGQIDNMNNLHMHDRSYSYSRVFWNLLM